METSFADRHKVTMSVNGGDPVDITAALDRFSGTEPMQSAPLRAVPGNAAGVTADQLKAFVERIERLEEEKASIAADIKDVYAEAKATGYDTKILRQVIRIRKMDKAEREEQEAMLDLYLHALGMIAMED